MWLIDREHCFVVTRGQTRATLTANKVWDYWKITFTRRFFVLNWWWWMDL